MECHMIYHKVVNNGIHVELQRFQEHYLRIIETFYPSTKNWRKQAVFSFTYTQTVQGIKVFAPLNLDNLRTLMLLLFGSFY